jgi:uncharacterized small protein (DUF1192 family)
MSLIESKVIDKIEIVEGGFVQVREALRVLRDGEIIAQNFHRFVVAPGQATQDMDPKVLAICAAVHTTDVIAAYQAEQARIAAEIAAKQAAYEAEQAANAPHTI